MKPTKEFMVKFQKAYYFISDHPAFGWIENNLDTMIMDCCKNGYALRMSPKNITKGQDDPRYEELVKAAPTDDKIKLDFWDNKGEPILEEEYKKYQLPTVEVDYERYYGYKWEFDHIEIWLESGAMRWISAEKRWERWHDTDLDCGGRTYEKAIINLAKKVKKRYGDYSKGDSDKSPLVPDWVREWNEAHPLDLKKIFSGGKFKSGPHIHINGIEFNELWWHKVGEKEFKHNNGANAQNIDWLLDYKAFKKKYM